MLPFSPCSPAATPASSVAGRTLETVPMARSADLSLAQIGGCRHKNSKSLAPRASYGLQPPPGVNSSPPVFPDPITHSARLRATSSRPLTCALVLGVS